MNNQTLRDVIDTQAQWQILWFVAGMVVMALIYKMWGKK